MYYLTIFLLWTFVIYWMHRLVHIVPVLREIHADHHKYVNNHEVSWHWSNLFLYNDTWKSTADLWITEVIPTIILSYFFGWWLLLCYYIWAAFVQESIEHNRKFDIYPIITSGKWHMLHHKESQFNYGIMIPLWDIVFRTRKQHK
jgi:sterol desaturase/sphingolipid hydroxylase (fatty acid hydroxylase superfamily)